MNEKFISLREQYKTFSYNGYSITEGEGFVELAFDFSLDGKCSFRPTTKIITDGLAAVNPFSSPEAESIVFSLGLVELISYWKAACPEKVIIRCGALSDEQVLWWKKLWWGGLGEFFYRNGIETDFDSFMSVESCGKAHLWSGCKLSGTSLVPVGGGKDSDVTLALLGEMKDRIKCFTVNDQPARTQGVLAAGLGEGDILRTYRTIAPELLALNREGFLNGHTPFSAIVAFLGLYCSYLIGAQNIVLSNESSANESSVAGLEVNHQYSKSYEFEQDFNLYVEKYFGGFAKYFSILRAFNELQIAAQFAALPQFHKVFVSCNVGSKKNIWCGKCGKCLFVYIILSPFLSEEKMVEIFGANLLDDEDLAEDFKGLIGENETKPFECVGTVSEARAAAAKTKRNYIKNGLPVPKLLKDFEADDDISVLLKEFNGENSIPDAFIKYVKEMYSYVSELD